MSKTTQVKVKIEDAIPNKFDLSFVVLCNDKLPEKLYTIINCKAVFSWRWNGLYGFKYREGQTRESVISSIWEYQKSLLPDGFEIHESTEIEDCEFLPDTPDDSETYYWHSFYDPAERIVTVTKWDVSSDVKQ